TRFHRRSRTRDRGCAHERVRARRAGIDGTRDRQEAFLARTGETISRGVRAVADEPWRRWLMPSGSKAAQMIVARLEAHGLQAKGLTPVGVRPSLGEYLAQLWQ